MHVSFLATGTLVLFPPRCARLQGGAVGGAARGAVAEAHIALISDDVAAMFSILVVPGHPVACRG